MIQTLLIMNTNSRTLLRKLLLLYTSRFPVEKGKVRLVNSFGRWLRHAGDSEVVRRGTGYMMQLDLEDMVQESIFFFGFYEKPLATYFISQLSEGMVFVDVGAHVGQYTLLASKEVGPTGHVYSFEPHPTNFEALSYNVRLNEFTNVSLYNAALADSLLECELFINAADAGRRNRGTHSLRVQKDWSRSAAIPIRAMRLDDVLGYVTRLDVLKIDVEGAELLVLKGAEKLLARFRPIIAFESAEESTASFGHSTTDAKRLLAERGYRLFKLPPENRRMSLLPTLATEADQFSTIVALPETQGFTNWDKRVIPERLLSWHGSA